MRIVLLVLISVWFSNDVLAQGALQRDGSASGFGTVEGQLVTGDQVPLAGGDIVLIEPSTGLPEFGAASTADGQFLVARVRPGTYTLRATFVGYATWEEEIVVLEGQTTRANPVLEARALPQPEVTVTARRVRPTLNPITTASIDRAELERRPAMKDLPAQLATLPSTTYYSENGNGIGYSYLRMRGFPQRRIAVAVNGIPQNDPEEFNVFWINFFDLQGSIQDIQVQRGAGSSFYGPAAIGGAINIRAMPYKPYPFATLEAGYGAFETRRMAVTANSGLLADRWVVYGRASRLLSDGYRDWSWSEYWRWFGGITRYGDRSTFTIQAYGGPQRDALAYIGIPKEANKGAVDDGFGGTIDRRYNYSAFTRDVEDFHQPHIEAFWEREIGDRLKMKHSLFGIKGEGYFDFDGTFRSADFLRLPDGTVEEGAESLPLYLSRPEVPLLFRAYLDQWQVGWLPSFSLRSAWGQTEFGGEARLHRSLRWGRIQDATGLPEAVVGDDADYRVYSVRGEKSIVSLFGSHLARPSDVLAIQADLQITRRAYRIFDEEFFGTSFTKPYVFVNPRIGVTVYPDQPLSAYVSVALANREPRMKSLYDGEEAGSGFEPQFATNSDGSLNLDDPFVKAEQLWDVELGAHLAQSRYRISANAFVMLFDDEIVPSGELDQFGVPRTGNADRTRHVGIELDGGIRLTPWADLTGNMTLSRNRFVDFTEFVSDVTLGSLAVDRSGNAIAGFPDRLINAAIVLRSSGATATLSVRSAGRQYVDNSNGRTLSGEESDTLVIDAYTLVDVSLRYQPKALSNLSLSLDINNLADRQVLLFGNAGFGAPQFFPAATRHVFFGARYTLR